MFCVLFLLRSASHSRMWPFWLGGFPCWVRNETFKAQQLNSSLIVAGMKSLTDVIVVVVSKTSLWFPWRETSWCTGTEGSQIPVCHRPVWSWPQGNVKTQEHQYSQKQNYSPILETSAIRQEMRWSYSCSSVDGCILARDSYFLCLSHKLQAAKQQTNSGTERLRPSTSLREWMERSMELQQTHDRLKAVTRNKRTGTKAVTTEAIKRTRTVWNKSNNLTWSDVEAFVCTECVWCRTFSERMVRLSLCSC